MRFLKMFSFHDDRQFGGIASDIARETPEEQFSAKVGVEPRLSLGQPFRPQESARRELVSETAPSRLGEGGCAKTVPQLFHLRARNVFE